MIPFRSDRCNCFTVAERWSATLFNPLTTGESHQWPYLDDPTTTRARWHCIGVNGRGKVHLWTFSLQCIFTHFGGGPSHCVIDHTFWITTAAVLIWMILQCLHRMTALVGHDSEAKMTGREDSAAHIWRLVYKCYSWKGDLFCWGTILMKLGMDGLMNHSIVHCFWTHRFTIATMA